MFNHFYHICYKGNKYMSRECGSFIFYNFPHIYYVKRIKEKNTYKEESIWTLR